MCIQKRWSRREREKKSPKIDTVTTKSQSRRRWRFRTFSRSVFGHLIPLPHKPALFIERGVLVAAVQNGLITTQSLTDVSQSLYKPEPQFLSLLSLIHSDVLDVTHASQTSQELLLNEYVPGRDNLIRSLQDDYNREVYLVGLDRGPGSESRSDRRWGM